MSKRMRQVKSLREWHYVVYRGARSGRRRSFTSRSKLLAEVYSKKSGKRVGYINRMSGTSPIPRKFSNKARLIYHVGVKVSRKSEESTHEDTFTIRYWKEITEEIPPWFTKILNDQIDRKSFIEFKLGLSGTDNKKLDHNIITEKRRYVSERTHKEWVDILSTLIVGTLRDKKNQIRTSPKKYAINLNKGNEYWRVGKRIAQWHFIKRYKVRLIITA